MVTVDSPEAVEQPVGHRLFAKYAHAPNSLGYCGPDGAQGLFDVACGRGERIDVRALARQFSGAWPYQVVLAGLAGVEDPLDARVVRGYWTGNALTESVDNVEFGRAMLNVIAPQAGGYWAHLNDELVREATPTHIFHVLGVYPWSRLLAMGRPEPLHVLDSCRISWGAVVEVVADAVIVRTRRLELEGSRLRLSEQVLEQVTYRSNGRSFTGDLVPGDHVAIHWGFICDRLCREEAERLEHWTRSQLNLTNQRLRRGERALSP